MQNERLLPVRLHKPGEIRLLDRGIDVGVPVVLEHPKEPIEPDIDARRLDHVLVVRLEAQAACVDLGSDVAV